LNEFIDPANYDDRFIIFITDPNNDNSAAVITGSDIAKLTKDIFEQLIKFKVRISDDDLRFIRWSAKVNISALQPGDSAVVYENDKARVYAIRVNKR
jgi:hypothetical protein